MILHAEIMVLVECEADLLRAPCVYLEGGLPLELDREGLETYIGGLERHLRDMRGLREEFARIISLRARSESGRTSPQGQAAA